MILERDSAWLRIRDSLQKADKVLVGIGTELEQAEGTDAALQKKAYDNLHLLLQERDYFVVSLCMDDRIYSSFEQRERIVCPCGSREVLQCAKACTKELYPVREVCPDILPLLERAQWEQACNRLSVCPGCGGSMEFNTIYAKQYLEEGYLPQWMKYKTWLQTTVNRKLCILEFGVGMQFPSVIRWAFDKLAYYNQKADFFRIHDLLYQHTKENGERGFSVMENGLDFLGSLEMNQ